MSKITNPEAFQLEAATILATAYSAFPMPFGWTHDPDSDVYPIDSGQSRKDIQFQTIQWLIDHDYLHDELGFVGGEWKGLLHLASGCPWRSAKVAWRQSSSFFRL